MPPPGYSTDDLRASQTTLPAVAHSREASLDGPDQRGRRYSSQTLAALDAHNRGPPLNADAASTSRALPIIAAVRPGIFDDDNDQDETGDGGGGVQSSKPIVTSL